MEKILGREMEISLWCKEFTLEKEFRYKNEN